MPEKVETVIVGGGQAGLALSYLLKQQGREHVVLERGAGPGEAWRSQRWDSFTLNTPNWGNRLPGAEYHGPQPDGFLSRAEIIAMFDQYAGQNDLPVRYHTRVEAVEPAEGAKGGFSVSAGGQAWQARNVVVATGLFQQPKIPAFAVNLPVGIVQLTAASYRSPHELPPGAVLVSGSGQSGCQIAEDLVAAGRKVYLCVGSAGRLPRRYRGKDIIFWLEQDGFFDHTAERLPSPQARFRGNPILSGTNGGHDLNLHQFHRDGIHLLGRLAGIQDGKALLAGDLKQNLARADQFEAEQLKVIDDYIARQGLDAPEEQVPARRDGFDAPELLWLDLRVAGVSTVIWAGGFSFDYSLVRLPDLLDEAGFPVTRNCATRHPGLYFLGLPWVVNRRSGVLLGVGADAARVCGYLTGEGLVD